MFSFFKRKKKEVIDPDMKFLITGLGNIGAEYDNTRHNIGFDVVDALVKEAGGEFETLRLAQVAKIKFKGKHLVVIKPTTYMNRSGRAIKYWMQKENIKVENTLTVVDDIALPTGILRLRKKGGAGGHNGLTDIIQNLGGEGFNRLRFGIGDNYSRGKQVDFVLGTWSRQEEEILTPQIDEAIEIIKSYVAIGVDRTMNTYNKRGVGK
jgi:PTH1 family peptidyl-tRNA hydrolase